MKLLSGTDIWPRDAQTGGKAAGLRKLQDAGFRVPAWVVIPNDFFLTEVLKGHTGRVEALQAIDTYCFPEHFLSEYPDFENDATFFAVRSSAIDEDGAAHSYAGQFQTFLYVKAEDLGEKIKEVWRSAFSERVLAYRSSMGLASAPGMAVIIQKMVNADVSGVAFGIDPVSGSRKTKVVNAVYGLGEGLVSGELVADGWKITAVGEVFHGSQLVGGDANQGHSEVFHGDVPVGGGTNRGQIEISAAIAAKEWQFKTDTTGALVKIPVLGDKVNIPCLDDKRLTEIASILNQLEQLYGKPQDIEFALENDTLYLLQSRPVTGLDKLADPDGDYIVWDNSNIIESYPGVTTPLTFSFIIKMYEAVYKQLSGLMGVNARDIEANANVYANMLGLLNGRVYYNLLSWYKLLAMLPGYSMNAGFMEKMMGVKERFELKDLPLRTRFAERLRVLNMVRVMLRNLRTLPRQRREFVAEFNAEMQRYSVIDFNTLNTQELMRLYFDFEGTMLKKWKAPLVNDFFTMIYFGLLQKIIQKYAPKARPSIHNDLLCGSRDIISVEPVKLTLNIQGLIMAQPAALKIFKEESPEAVWQQLERKEYIDIKNAIDEYIARFGERVVGELKLETISYKQNPLTFIKILQSMCRQANSMKTGAYNQEETRLAAEKEMNGYLESNPLKKMLYRYFLRKTREMVSSRENLRYERTRAFGIIRQIFSAMGRQFYAINLLDDARDIFYLKKEEIFDFIQGTSVTQDLKTLVANRKVEFAAYEGMPFAERIETYGMVYQGNDFTAAKKKTVEGDLKGIGCCPGVVKGRVRVLQRPDDMESLEGDILVTASTDPGWVLLFPTAAAILVERGSLLSHSAIVSREMGIPCIVGITGLLDRLKTGDVVEMDGATGEMKILEGYAG